MARVKVLEIEALKDYLKLKKRPNFKEFFKKWKIGKKNSKKK